jgi:nucleoside-diphosphate-sugar epimerase
MRVLVTGGAGFIGSHLVDRLLADGHEVRVLDNFTTGYRRNLAHIAGDFDLVEGDIQSYERGHNAVKNCEMVLHQAALPSVPRSIRDPLTSNAANVIGSLNILLAARDSGVQRVVHASSSSVYGGNETLPKQEALTPLPISPYAVAKLASEGYCRSFAEVYGLETVSLRYFNVFGPRQDPASEYAAVIPRFIRAGLTGDRLTVFGDGEQSRDFTFVDNVVEANVLAMEAPAANGPVYNVASGTRVTLNQLIKSLKELMGTDLEVEHHDARAGEIRHSHADVTRARTELGYEVVTDFKTGLARTLEYFRDDLERRGEPLGCH